MFPNLPTAGFGADAAGVVGDGFGEGVDAVFVAVGVLVFVGGVPATGYLTFGIAGVLLPGVLLPLRSANSGVGFAAGAGGCDFIGWPGFQLGGGAPTPPASRYC